MVLIDPIRFGKVAVLLGGVSCEREVSLQSGNSVLKALRSKHIDAHPFDPAEIPLFELKRRNFSRVFNALHGGYGENGMIQGALEFLGIPYTGSGILGSALCMDKFRTKLIWEQCGVPVPPYRTVFLGEDYEQCADKIISELNFPLFVKPATGGSSIGIFKVLHKTQLNFALTQVTRSAKIAIVEEAIEGKEYSITLVNDIAFPIIQIVPVGDFYDFHAKYVAEDTKYLVPSGLSLEEESFIEKLTRRAFRALDCAFWGRADFMINHKGSVYFLEINTVPGMTAHSLSPKAAKAIGIEYADFVIMILTATLKNV